MMGVFNKYVWVWSLLICLSKITAYHKIYPHHPLHLQRTIDEGDVDPHIYRTGYHFQPKKNWINDPNAPMYYKGFYHLFYQYNPKGAVWGNIVWAHSVSKDMVNWVHLEPAIEPSEPFDKYGCWSGSATVYPGDKPVLYYTGIIKEKPAPGYQVQAYAIPANHSDPYLRKWIKPADNPIIKPTSENVSAFRDPTTAWYNNGHWKFVVGSRHNHRGIAYLYRSRDLITWVKAKHPFHSKKDTGMWECPDFYPVSSRGTHGLDTSALGNHVKYVFKNSLEVTRYEYYTLGRYDLVKDRYIPDNSSVDGWGGLRYDYGNFYASKSFYDPIQKRRIVWGWANESSTSEEDIAKGWAGIQLIPRKVWLDHSGKQLLQWPICELEKLRCQKTQLHNVKVHKGEIIEIKEITAVQADIDVIFSFSSLDKAEWYEEEWGEFPQHDLGKSICGVRGATVQGGLGPFGFLTLASHKLEEYTPVFFRIFKIADNKHKVLLCSDATPSSLNEKEYKPSFGGFVDVDLTEKKLSLRSLIDHSVVESFAEGGKTAITSRVYPTLAVSKNVHLHVFNNGLETITIKRLNAWSMNTAYMN
ncbi:beta-fructofuranosidase, insoluble isoenzyme 3-like isoform X1 [Cynara cardunculus var. scolymus]|uniref:beta-fructofuranosidase, insoluble isoenzyme 3-like isoform X1 n=1 Tax=Cynara cardunculus var. scolymus TaxID=59895 RepID=UPI000D62B2BE|nr:beta-fructofuranosidase, insoluble isoenzyme 3-like isoform X1 [Cynara cardunculus var. scolymus]